VIVDYLCNAFTPERAAAWDAAIAAQGIPLKVRRDPDDSFCDAPTMVARMDELGIATLVLAAGDESHHGGHVEHSIVSARPDEVDELHRRWPGRFVAMWSIDPTLAMGGVARASEVLERPWAVGLFIHTHSFDRRFDHADYYPYYALGVTVAMQAGTSGGLAPSECGRPIGIDRPAIYFPRTNFVLSHTGWPWVDEAVAMALKFPNVYLGTASYPPRHWSPAVVDFARRAGRAKVIFGTNFPTVGHRHALAQVAELGLDEDVARAILEGNARRAFPRLGPSPEGKEER
jgi:predicted TIM-barrel fold metal-dependent hydrolase